ncbi:MAG: Nramp family divalent metal transporter [Bacteroidia bacterium]|nr:Nramp family divalent metal transporter [Bacteroidia bacterium]
MQNHRFLRFLRNLGPGIITAALVFGPGSLTVASKLGAGFGYQLLWVIPLGLVFMAVFTQMSARIGLASRKSLIDLTKEHYGRGVAILTGIGIFLVTAAFQAGNSIGVGIAFGEWFHTSSTPFVLAFSALAIGLLFFPGFYKMLEKVMIFLVGIMLIAFLITVFVAKPAVGEFLQGLFVPRLPGGSVLLVAAITASSFSIVGAFYQSYLVRAKGWDKSQRKVASAEALTGITILGMITLMVMAAAGAVLHPQGIEVNTATDMGRAMEPLFGSFSKGVFLLGLFGAAFSSLLGNATIGGAILAETLGLEEGFHRFGVRICIMVVIVLGATTALVFGRLPLEMIVFAQAVTIYLAPLIGLVIFLIANKKSVMGDLANSRTQNVLGAVGLLILVILAGNNLRLIVS